jgi:hypothetical protein
MSHVKQKVGGEKDEKDERWRDIQEMIRIPPDSSVYLFFPDALCAWATQWSGKTVRDSGRVQ